MCRSVISVSPGVFLQVTVTMRTRESGDSRRAHSERKTGTKHRQRACQLIMTTITLTMINVYISSTCPMIIIIKTIETQ